MKIGPIDEIVRQTGTGSVQKPGTETGTPFGEILNQAMDGSPRPNTGARSVSPGDGVAPIQMNPVVPGITSPLVNRVDDFLNTLDEYRQRLGDHDFSLKDIDPLVQKMERETENLMPAFKSLSETDGLKKILDQTLMTASLEIVRFNRGDYVTT